MRLAIIVFVFFVAYEYLFLGPQACQDIFRRFRRKKNSTSSEKNNPGDGWPGSDEDSKSPPIISYPYKDDDSKSWDHKKFKSEKPASPIIPAPSFPKHTHNPGSSERWTSHETHEEHEQHEEDFEMPHQNPPEGMDTIKPLTIPERETAVRRTNQYRRDTNATSMQQLVWNLELAASAGKKGSDACEKEPPPTKSYSDEHGYETVLQNSYAGTRDTLVESALDKWGAAAGKYTHDSWINKCPWGNTDCHRYEQMIWEIATGIGCAKVECPNEGAFEAFNVHLLCLYGLNGKATGKPYTKAQTEREIGSECKKKYQKKVVDGLCFGDADPEEDDDNDDKSDDENVPVPISPDEEIEIENFFNDVRVHAGAIKMNRLKWNDEIQKDVDKYGNDFDDLTPPDPKERQKFVIIGWGSKIGKHDSIRMTAYFEGTKRPSVHSVLSLMNPEAGKKLYDGTSTGNCGELGDKKELQQCRQYKQIVSARTSQVGCAMVKHAPLFSKTSFRMICEFVPPMPVTPAYEPGNDQRPPGSGCKVADTEWPKLCVAEDDEPGPDDTKTNENDAIPLVKKEEDRIVELLNDIRRGPPATAMNKLILEPTLATHAEKIGKEQCRTLQAHNQAHKHYFVTIEPDHERKRSRMTFYIEGTKRPNVENAVNLMNSAHGKQHYDKLNGDCNDVDEKHHQYECLQYKQIVSARTNRVGCAMVKCDRGLFSSDQSFRLVCEFTPPYPPKDVAYTPADRDHPVGSGCKNKNAIDEGLCVDDAEEEEESGPELENGAIPLGEEEVEEVLEILNDARSNARGTAINQLVWNNEMAHRAGTIAGKCYRLSSPQFPSDTPTEFVMVETHTDNTYLDSVGIIYHTVHVSKKPSIAEALDYVARGRRKFKETVLTEQCKDACLRYKQAVWAETTEVGCFMAKCGGKQPSFRVLCEFFPPYDSEVAPYTPPYIREDELVKAGDHCGDKFGKKADPKTKLCTSTALTETEQHKILHSHNRVRAAAKALAMNKLEQNSDLDTLSEELGNKCQRLSKDLTVDHHNDPQQGPAGVSIIYRSDGISRPALETALDYVTSIRPRHDSKVLKGECDGDHVCLATRQVLWSVTDELGCAMVKCPKPSLLKQTVAGAIGNFFVGAEKPSIRLVCEYQPGSTHERDAYVPARGDQMPGSECHTFGRKPVQYGDDPNSVLCVKSGRPRNDGRQDWELPKPGIIEPFNLPEIKKGNLVIRWGFVQELHLDRIKFYEFVVLGTGTKNASVKITKSCSVEECKGNLYKYDDEPELQVGTYMIRMRAHGDGGKMSEENTVSFEIVEND